MTNLDQRSPLRWLTALARAHGARLATLVGLTAAPRHESPGRYRIELRPRNCGRTTQMAADIRAAADAFERAYGRRPNVLMIPASLLKPEDVEAGDRESNRIELGVYARMEAQRRALARDFPGFARAYLAPKTVEEPLEGVKSPPAQGTEPTDWVRGPSPIRRAWRAWRLAKILKGLERRHE